jgi:hypothetical protein
VVRIKTIKNEHKILVLKLDENRLFGRIAYRLMDVIKNMLK